MKRYLTSHILKDLTQKIVLLTGPRQNNTIKSPYEKL